jgi:hypothetical protein
MQYQYTVALSGTLLPSSATLPIPVDEARIDISDVPLDEVGFASTATGFDDIACCMEFKEV